MRKYECGGAKNVFITRNFLVLKSFYSIYHTVFLTRSGVIHNVIVEGSPSNIILAKQMLDELVAECQILIEAINI